VQQRPRPTDATRAGSRDCLRCGHAMEEKGEYHLPAPPGHDVQSGGSVSYTFRFGIPVVAMTCPNCGHLELFDEHVLRGGVPRVRIE
jgi:hypothetical protein